LENRLWLALEQSEFELLLQPQIDLQSGRVIGAEALIRWHHPEMGMVPPDRFIPLAEESGLMLPLGEWVLQRAVDILADWAKRGMPPMRLALNLSARQCHVGELLPCIDRLIESSGIATDMLEMEITESAAMHDPEQTRLLLHELRLRGIKVAIDDFGTGYSSLSYLKLFAIDRIKIDRSFVKDIETDTNDAVIVNATIALAHSLGLEVIAEGVETAEQSHFLRANGCDEAQGYFFGRPMPLAEFERFVLSKLERTEPEPASIDN
jgi:EAL domain-containing protein (putative c-di-GMP-specific phosphodiesterase class I)